MKYKMNRFTAMLLTLIMIVCTWNITGITNSSVEAATYHGKCGSNATWEFDSDTRILNIVGTGAMYGYEIWSEAPWYSYRNQIEKVEISEGITNISKYAFRNVDMVEISIPSTVEIIREGAFYGCDKLESVNIPEKVNSIEDSAFQGCISFESVYIPKNVSYIGTDVFIECDKLKTIIISEENKYYDSRDNCNAIIETKTNKFVSGITTSKIPSGVTIIGKYAFMYNEKIANIEIPNSVTIIEAGAFWGCGNLESVVIPENVTIIGGSAFYYCERFEEIHIPASVTSIGDNAFAACGAVMSITVDPDNKYYDSRDNCNAIIETATGKLLKGSNNTTVIPHGVTYICDMAFYYCDKLEKVVIPDTVEGMGKRAFSDCTGIKELSIPCSVDFYQTSYVFLYCDNIEKVTITKGNGVMPDFIKDSGTDKAGPERDRAPWNRSALNITELIIEEGVTYISEMAFYSMPGLTKLVIPNSVTKIGEDALSGTSNLKELTMPASLIISNANSTFSGFANLEKITLTKGIGTMPDYSDTLDGTDTYYQYTPWYKSRDTLEEIVLEEGIENIGNYTFYGNTESTTLTTVEGINTVGTNAISPTIKVRGFGFTPIYDIVKSQGNSWECIEHGFSEFTPEKEATCEENGTMISTCDYCGKSENFDIVASHLYVEKVVAPTTTEQGYTLHKCLNCGQSYKDTFVDQIEETTEPETTEPETTLDESTTKPYEEITTTYVSEETTTTNRKQETESTVLGKAKIKSAKNVKKKSIILKIKKVAGAKKYKIQYSTNKKFKKNVKSKTTKKLNITIKKLQKGKTYYIRVRAISEKQKGAWSNKKKVQIRK